MKNIRQKEKEVLDEFKNLVLIDKEGNPHPIPAVFGDRNRVWSFANPTHVHEYEGETVVDRIRLPIIGLNTVEVAQSSILLEGAIYTLFREDMNQIIEQLHNTIELNEKITISPVKINQNTASKGESRIHICVGTFTVEYRE